MNAARGGTLSLMMVLGLTSVSTGCGPLVTKGEVLSTLAPAGSDAVTDAGTPCTPRVDSANWPVKVVFVVENGGRMCIVDPPGAQSTGGFCEMYSTVPPGVVLSARLQAISRFFAANVGRPNVQAAVVAFDSKPTIFPFQQVSAGVPSGVMALQGQLGPASDLQGGLAATAALVEQDILATPASLRPRTRYVVVVLGSGVPFPRCSANDSLSQYASPLQPDVTWADSSTATSFCNSDPVPMGTFEGFTVGGDRNQNAQLAAEVDRLTSLDALYSLGDLRVHSRVLLNSTAVSACGLLCTGLGLPGLNEDRGEATFTMGLLAQRGGGSFVDPSDPQAVTLDTVDTTEFTTFCP